ncbi:MAG TPA: hypothetical protein DER09_09915 [Prolixibacteraceae bacterium]|nr:hypothetical protein [Prolixibacteraceae bacterium]
MNKVVYNGQELTNWIDYIERKFADSNYFEKEIRADNNFILIKSKNSKTKIWFYGLTKNSTKLEDCQYSNDDCHGWSGETCGVNPDKYGIFNQDNIDSIDRLLDTPILKGWTSKEFYLGKSFYKALVYPDKDLSQPPFKYYGNRFGCFIIFLFPVFIILNLLLGLGLIGEMREIIIEPIIYN